MLKACIFALAAASAVSASTLSFSEYVAKFQKPYVAGTREYTMRQQLFNQRAADVAAHNSAGHSWTKAINKFSDWTEDELSNRLMGYRRTSFPGELAVSKPAAPADAQSLPASVDWRKKGVLSAIKDQGHCGSCWAFATTENVESHVAIATGDMFDLSPQQLVSCAANPDQCGGYGGCSGSIAELAYDYVKSKGMTESFTWGYESYWGTTNGTCTGPSSKAPSVVSVGGYKKVDTNNQTAVMEALVLGPLTVNVDASTWHSYNGGVFDGCPSGSQNVDINHVVQLVGYGSENGEDYWVVRNSWSAAWGEHGYIRLRRRAQPQCGTDSTPQDGTECKGGPSSIHVCGPCGMLWDTSYPTGARVL